MPKIRVLVANRSRLMRDLVITTIADQPDIEVIGEVSADSEVERGVAEHSPDFVIITFDRPNQRPALCDHLLARYPELKVLAMSPSVNKSSCFWTATEIHSASFESSEAGLLSILRGTKMAKAPARVN